MTASQVFYESSQLISILSVSKMLDLPSDIYMGPKKTTPWPDGEGLANFVPNRYLYLMGESIL